jgi:TRAP-type C4-dicarboxylate transport system permease small subunit
MRNKAIQIGQRLSKVAAWAGGIILLLTAILITTEVVLRKVFTVSMGGADEISGYAIAISCSFGFSYALFQKAHIRIDVLYNKFPAFVRRVLDIVSHISLGIYLSLLSYFGFQVFWTSFIKGSTANTPLHTPMWIPQLIWVVGLLGFAFSIAFILAMTLYCYLKKDFKTADMLSSTTTLMEEIQKDSIDLDTREKSVSGGVK